MWTGGRVRDVRRRVGLALAAWLMVSSGIGVADENTRKGGTEDAPDYSGLSLEELGRVDLVYAASRHDQSRSEAPSSVSIVTAEEIRRHGYRTLGDVLRSVGSFYLTDDRNYGYVGVRGFSRPGDYNTRILVLMDGVRLNEPVYDASYVGREFVLDPAIVDRVEVVRGPGASMYGNSAFFAVINVVTKQGRQLRGGEASASAGSFRDVGGRLTWGTVTSGGIDVVASVSASHVGGRRLYFPEFDATETGDGVADHLDHEDAQNAFARVSRGRWSLRAAHVSREKGIPTGSYGTVFGDTRSRTTDGLTIVSGAFEGALSQGVDGAFRLHYGASAYDGSYAFDSGPTYDDGARGRWWAADWNVTMARRGRHMVTVGGEFVRNFRLDQFAAYDDAQGFDLREPNRRWGMYAQDEVELAPNVLASVGLRHDQYESFGGRTSPRLGLIVNAAGPTTLKALFGTAFRAPNVYELHYYGEVDLRPETIRTGELIVERSFGRTVHASASAFWNDIDGLITLDTDAQGDLFFRNAGRIRSRGFEASLEGRRAATLLRGTYSFQRTSERTTGAELSNSPRHLAKASLSVPFAARFTAAADAQYVSSRRTLAGRSAAGAVLVDLNLVARSLSSRLEAALAVRNALDATYASPGSEEHRQDVIPQDGRSFALTLTWRF